MLTVACVWVGEKYGFEYVDRLRDGVARHLDRKHRFLVLTDRIKDVPWGVDAFRVDSKRYPTWWSKFYLQDPLVRGVSGRCIYLDLDMVIVGDLGPLADVPAPFATCRNFTQLLQIRQKGSASWPCRYGSCAMVWSPGYGGHIWNAFEKNAEELMKIWRRGGDQRALEAIAPRTPYLQDHLPGGFFLHYKDLEDVPDPRASVVVFGGRTTPANTPRAWAREAWLSR